MRAYECGTPNRQVEASRDVPTDEHSTILSGYPPTLTPAQIGEVLNLSAARVRDLLRRGELPGVRIGNLWRSPRVALEALLAGRWQA
jgi:excisionase family DNA binding protein